MGEYWGILTFVGLAALGLLAIIVGSAKGIFASSKEIREWRDLALRRGWTLDGAPRFKGEIDWKKKYGPHNVLFDLNSFIGSVENDELAQTNFDVYGMDLRGAGFAILSEERLRVFEQRKKSSRVLAMAIANQGPCRLG